MFANFIFLKSYLLIPLIFTIIFVSILFIYFLISVISFLLPILDFVLLFLIPWGVKLGYLSQGNSKNGNLFLRAKGKTIDQLI